MQESIEISEEEEAEDDEGPSAAAAVPSVVTGWSSKLPVGAPILEYQQTFFIEIICPRLSLPAHTGCMVVKGPFPQ